jgi:acetyl-CoA carboxylase biotin carboxyl carrier protein
VCAEIAGTVWKVEVSVGERVEAGQTVVLLESMKMEVPVEAPEGGQVQKILVEPGAAVEDGQVLLLLD